MTGHVEKALQRFCHIPATRIQNSPHAWIPPHYGVHKQMTPPPDDSDDSDKLDRAGITRLQEVIGVFLLYGRAVDCTILVALGTLASQQADDAQATAKSVTQLRRCHHVIRRKRYVPTYSQRRIVPLGS
jgi:hypothetical protein